ncbi:MAG: DinB family protein [Ignavibacteria bacterium]|nr:DinB family protein [Ignavibacteria bacterium]
MKELTKFSIEVRESTLKRLRAVPIGSEDWRVDKDSMSFADIAQHIIDCDLALIESFHTKNIGSNLGKAHSALTDKYNALKDLIEKLEETKNKRAVFIEGLNQNDLSEIVSTDRKEGEQQLTMELLILTMLDHETHHRGQLSVYLKMIGK